MPATSRSGEVGPHALGERAQRLALEVEQRPSRGRARRAPGRGGSRRGCVAGQASRRSRPRRRPRARPCRRPASAGTSSSAAAWRRLHAGQRASARSLVGGLGRWAATSASVAWTSAVADAEGAGAVAEVLAAAPRRRAATRQASSTPGRNSWAKARCPCAGAAGAALVGHSPETWPNGRRHQRRARRGPARTARRRRGSRRGAGRGTPCRSTACGAPSAVAVSQMIEVLDCSPRSTRDATTVSAGLPGCRCPRAARGCRRRPRTPPDVSASMLCSERPRRRRGRAGRRRPSAVPRTPCSMVADQGVSPPGQRARGS